MNDILYAVLPLNQIQSNPIQKSTFIVYLTHSKSIVGILFNELDAEWDVAFHDIDSYKFHLKIYDTRVSVSRKPSIRYHHNEWCVWMVWCIHAYYECISFMMKSMVSSHLLRYAVIVRTTTVCLSTRFLCVCIGADMYALRHDAVWFESQRNERTHRRSPTMRDVYAYCVPIAQTPTPIVVTVRIACRAIVNASE